MFAVAVVLLALFDFTLLRAEIRTLADLSARGKAPPMQLMWEWLSGLMRFGQIACGGLWWVVVIQAARNVRAFGATSLKQSHDALVLWWFAPILNWVMPYLGIIELWKASAAAAEGQPTAWSSMRTPVFIGLWWALWVIHQVAWMLCKLHMGEDPVEKLQILLLFAIVRDVAMLAAAPLAVLVLVGISRNQMRAVVQMQGRNIPRP